MIKSVVTLLLLQVVNTAVAQESKLEIQFDHEWSLRKFLVTQVSVAEGKSIPGRKPYVHSATLKLALNISGEVTALEFIERAEDNDFNIMFERMARSTSGKWKFVEVAEEVEQVYVIIPFLHRTPPDLESEYPKELEEQFNNYHKSLSFENFEGCNETNCIIWKQIRNYTGTPVR